MEYFLYTYSVANKIAIIWKEYGNIYGVSKKGYTLSLRRQNIR